jgi:molybdenum cofactor cytidylyltransferase
VAMNARWPAGMGTSIRAGMEALCAGPGADGVDAAVLAVCDQPFFSARIVGDLIAAHERSGCDIVAAAYAGTRGVPALFSRSLFPELLALDGHEGARRVIRAHPDRTLAVPFGAGAVDLDTPEDCAGLSLMPGETAVA